MLTTLGNATTNNRRFATCSLIVTHASVSSARSPNASQKVGARTSSVTPPGSCAATSASRCRCTAALDAMTSEHDAVDVALAELLDQWDVIAREPSDARCFATYKATMWLDRH